MSQCRQFIPERSSVQLLIARFSVVSQCPESIVLVAPGHPIRRPGVPKQLRPAGPCALRRRTLADSPRRQQPRADGERPARRAQSQKVRRSERQNISADHASPGVGCSFLYSRLPSLVPPFQRSNSNPPSISSLAPGLGELVAPVGGRGGRDGLVGEEPAGGLRSPAQEPF